MKIYVCTKTCTWMFIAIVSIIAKIWKQPKCPLIGEEIEKLVYLYGILFSYKNKCAIKPRKGMEEPYVHIAKWKKLV